MKDIYHIIRESVEQADMVLLGFGDEFSNKKAEKDAILAGYEKIAGLIAGKPWFAVTLNTDDLIYESSLSEFFIVAPCGSEKTGNLVTNEDYDESTYLSQWQYYTNWLTATIGKKLCILEFGVGMSYPSVVRIPFERMTQYNEKAKLIRVHSKLAFVPEEAEARSICVQAKPTEFLADM